MNAPIAPKNTPITPHYNRHTSKFAIRTVLITTTVLGIILFLMVNYLGYKFYKREDFTQSRINQLSPRTIETLKSLTSPITLITYFGTLSETNPTLYRYINNLIKEYLARSGDKIKVENVDSAMDIARAEILAKKYNLYNIDDVIILDYQDRFRTLTAQQLAEFYPESPFEATRRIKNFNGEREITAAIQALIEGQETKVYYLIGHGQPQLQQPRSNRSISEFESRVKRENIQLIPLNLAQTQEIPKDAAALMILGPRTKLSDDEITLIQNYLEKQGRLILFQDPQVESGLEPILQEYGLKLNNDIGVIRFPGATRIISQTIIANEFANHPATAALIGFNLNIPFARSIQTGLPQNSTKGGINIDLVKTIPGYWGETDMTNTKNIEFNSGIDTQGPLTIAALYAGASSQDANETTHGARIILIGSASYLFDSFINLESSLLTTNLLSWLTKTPVSLAIPPKTPQEFPLSLTPLQLRTISIFALVVLPGIALGLGILSWFSRRR
jgi:ABC-type uncharacterized transport system involved in gliding motility auxiliary subunit